MKKYNNYKHYKSNKSFQVQRIQSSSWILFNENKVQLRKESSRLTNINKNNFRI